MRGDIRVLIRQRREELEKTQEEMAEELHITPRYYQQLETGWASPSLSLTLDIANLCGSIELQRTTDATRYAVQALKPDSDTVYLNCIDRSPCAILMKLAEEEDEGASLLKRELMKHINRIRDFGENSEALAEIYEQCVCDVQTALDIVREWFMVHRPDVVQRAERRHREKMWEKGYTQSPPVLESPALNEALTWIFDLT